MSHSSKPAAPQQVPPQLALATELLWAGQPAEAIAPLRDAAQLQPSNPTIQHDLGLACLETGRLVDAIAAFQRAIAGNPRYADAYFLLGIAMEKQGNLRAAIVAYHRATQLLPPWLKLGSAPARWFTRWAIATRRSAVFDARPRPEARPASAGLARRGHC